MCSHTTQVANRLYALLIACRPKQWVKNLLVLPALIFSGNLNNDTLLTTALLAACTCTLASSATYLR